MGPRRNSGKSKLLSNNHNTKEDLPYLVDKLLRICSQQNVCDLENHREIDFLVNKIKSLETNVINENNIDRLTAVGEFTKWAEENGAKFQGCEISAFEKYEMGVKTNAAIPESSLVISVPRSLMLTASNVTNDDLKDLFDKDHILKNMPNVRLAMLLLYEKFKKNSFWKPYINILPKEYNTTLYFTMDELNELRGSPTCGMALGQIKSIARQFGYFYKLFHTSQDTFSRSMKSKFTYSEYCWAVSTVMTRQNSIPSEDGTHMINALIPLWDMCNHTNGTITTEYNPESNRCECIALKSYEPGEQFLIFYGARTNAEFFIHNGFVYEDNVHDGYWLRLGVSKSDKLQNKRIELLKKLTMLTNNEYFIFKGSRPVDEQTLAFLRIFNMNEDELDDWLAREMAEDLHRLDYDNENKVLARKSWQFLLTRLKIYLNLYKTSLEDDVKLLSEENLGKLSRNGELAVRMRMCEKRILNNAIGYAQNRLDELGK